MLGIFVMLLLVIVLVVAAIVIATGSTNTVVHYSKVIAHDFQTGYNKLSHLISQYTK